jgi:hypothetical protein
VQHALVVRGREARTQLPGDLDRLVLRQAANATRERSEVLAADVLHRQEVAIIDLTDVEDAAHVRVRHAE